MPAMAPDEAAGGGGRPRYAGGPREFLALLLLSLGSLLLPVVGWLAGAALLWSSRAWDRRDKLAGTLLPPGGYNLLLALALVADVVTCVRVTDASGRVVSDTCPDDPAAWSQSLALALAAVLALLPLLTAVYLARRLWRARGHL